MIDLKLTITEHPTTAGLGADKTWNCSGFINDYGGDKLYVFADVDCFDPPIYLVLGDSFADAYENFLDVKGTRLTDDDIAEMRAEYGDDESEWPEVSMIDGGDIVHTGNLYGYELTDGP